MGFKVLQALLVNPANLGLQVPLGHLDQGVKVEQEEWLGFLEMMDNLDSKDNRVLSVQLVMMGGQDLLDLLGPQDLLVSLVTLLRHIVHLLTN